MITEKVNFYENPQDTLKTTVEFERTHGADPRFIDIVKELDQNLHSTYNNYGYKYDIDIQVGEVSTVILASIGEIVIGGGCFKPLDDETAEVKRVFVSPYFRGLSVGSGLMEEVICWAQELGFKNLVLETGELQEESIRLFKRQGFSVIENFGSYVGVRGSICMARKL